MRKSNLAILLVSSLICMAVPQIGRQVKDALGIS